MCHHCNDWIQPHKNDILNVIDVIHVDYVDDCSGSPEFEVVSTHNVRFVVVTCYSTHELYCMSKERTILQKIPLVYSASESFHDSINS